MLRYALLYLLFFASAVGFYYGCVGLIEYSQPVAASDMSALLLLWILFFPLVLWLIYGGAVAYCKTQTVPIQKRRRVYLLAITFAVPVAACVHLLFAYFLAVNGTLKNFAISMEDPNALLLIVFGPLLGVVFVAVAQRVALGIEGKLFAPDLPPVSLKLHGPEKQYSQWNARSKMAAILFLAGWLIYFIPSIFEDQPLTKEVLALAGTALLLGVWLSGFKDRKSLRKFGRGEPNEQLTERAKVLANIIGTKPKRVLIKEGIFADRVVMGRAFRTAISITEGAVQYLTPEQMDFLLAHELAHYRQSYFNRVLAASLCFLLPAVGLTILYSRSDFAHRHPPTTFLATLVLIPLYMLFMKGLRLWGRKREFEADNMAATAVRSSAAGVECLSICRTTSLRPFIHDYSFGMHPPLELRLAALRSMPASQV